MSKEETKMTQGQEENRSSKLSSFYEVFLVVLMMVLIATFVAGGFEIIQSGPTTLYSAVLIPAARSLLVGIFFAVGLAIVIPSPLHWWRGAMAGILIMLTFQNSNNSDIYTIGRSVMLGIITGSFCATYCRFCKKRALQTQHNWWMKTDILWRTLYLALAGAFLGSVTGFVYGYINEAVAAILGAVAPIAAAAIICALINWGRKFDPIYSKLLAPPGRYEPPVQDCSRGNGVQF